jgi:xylan 1,4-beta-xylosidase
VDKPVLNAFRMLGLLGNDSLPVTSSAALPTDEIVRSGVRTVPDINALATRGEREVEILAWNYHDEDVSSPPANIDLVIAGLPMEVKRSLVEHFRVDSDHSNAFAAWLAMGSPSALTQAQREQLRRAGELQLLTSPEWVVVDQGKLKMSFPLPRQALSLIRLSW